MQVVLSEFFFFFKDDLCSCLLLDALMLAAPDEGDALRVGPTKGPAICLH